MILPSEILLQAKDNPNLVWIIETVNNQLIFRTEETTETITNTTTDAVDENQIIVTQQITRTVVKKNIMPINNTTSN